MTKRKYRVDHLHTPEVAAKISSALKGNTNGRHTRGIKKPGSREAGVKNLKEGLPARMASPLGGPFETCAWAKEYDLIDPSGKRHTGRNVKLFVRENPELFDPADIAPKSKGEYPITNASGRLSALLNDPNRKSWKGWIKPEGML